LVVMLGAGWLLAAHRPHAAAEVTAPFSSPTSVAPSSVRTTTTVPRTPDCRGLTSARREVRCVLDTVALDVRLYSLGTVAAASRRAADAAGEARTGPPACARGVPDERAWSVAAFPEAAVGRYRCRFERGLAAMWWTWRDRLFHAVAPDGDLARLFAWWRSHPAE
jgi:hypothetical protein